MNRWIVLHELEDALGGGARSLAKGSANRSGSIGRAPADCDRRERSAQPPSTSAEQWLEMRSSRDTHIKELSKLSRNSKFVLDPTSGHNIEHDNPKLVTEAIQELKAINRLCKS